MLTFTMILLAIEIISIIVLLAVISAHNELHEEFNEFQFNYFQSLSINSNWIKNLVNSTVDNKVQESRVCVSKEIASAKQSINDSVENKLGFNTSAWAKTFDNSDGKTTIGPAPTVNERLLGIEKILGVQFTETIEKNRGYKQNESTFVACNESCNSCEDCDVVPAPKTNKAKK